jgi:hypothetical protein
MTPQVDALFGLNGKLSIGTWQVRILQIFKIFVIEFVVDFLLKDVLTLYSLQTNFLSDMFSPTRSNSWSEYRTCSDNSAFHCRA